MIDADERPQFESFVKDVAAEHLKKEDRRKFLKDLMETLEGEGMVEPRDDDQEETDDDP